MKRFLSLLLLGAAATAADAPQLDVMKAAPAHYRVLVENDHVRVVENTLPPGGKDGLHTHAAGWYYVTHPGRMKVVHEDGKSEVWEAKAGESGWLKAEGPHTSENLGDAPLGFVLVEVKSAAQR
jgi:oxalate decarboxylase/phosphoglucose isomerase-like protein (cupin superfamily)